MPLRTVALVGAVCLISGWLLASVLMPPTANLQALPERRAPERPAVDQMPAAYSEQLKLKLDRLPAAPVPRRNPFLFGGREPVSTRDAARSGDVQPAAPILPAEPMPPVGPIFSLSGMAVTETAEGPVRTAVVSDGETVHLVKIGQTIGGYSVTAITDDTVTLVDGSGSQSVLRLRQ